MSITEMRTKLGRHALLAILAIGGLAILLPVFFSGAGPSNRSQSDDARTAYIKDQQQAVARVGDEEILRSDVNAVIDAQAQQMQQMAGRDASPLDRHQMLPGAVQQLEDQAILIAAAKREGISVSSGDVQKEIDKAVQSEEERLGINALNDGPERKQYEAQVRADVGSKRDQIRNSLLVQKFADKQRSKITLDTPGLKPEDIEVNARHILITWKGLPSADKKVTRTKAEAKALADKLAAQAKANPGGFAALADQNTEDASGKGKGGDLGWFTRTTMVKPFADAAFKAKSGEIVGPVESQFGYHVIKVEDRRVSQARGMQEVQKYLDSARKTAKIQILAPDVKAALALQDMSKIPAKDTKAQAAKRQEVIADYQAAAKARPTDPAVFAMLGSLYRQASDPKDAIAAYQQAAALTPPIPEVHLALGDLYRQQKQKQEALDHYRTAGRLAGNDMMTHVMLQMAYHDMGEKELAKQQSEWLKNAQAQRQQTPMTIPGG